MAGPEYNVNEKVFGFSIRGAYTGFFPIIGFELEYGGRSSTKKINNKEVIYGWRETSAELEFLIPFNLSRGIYYCSLTLGTGIQHTRITDSDESQFNVVSGQFTPVHYVLNFSRYRHSSIRDLNPSWGQHISVLYRNTPWKGDYKGSMFSLRAGLYFPGLFKHHSPYLKGGFEIQQPENYIFENEILFPRGYDYSYYDTIYKASINYSFPVAYPDWSLGTTFYLKRLKANLFYDLAIGKFGTSSTDFQSAGIELLLDFHIIHLPIQFELGSRFVYRFRDNKFRLEFLAFNFNL